jgi:hypothetical protein
MGMGKKIFKPRAQKTTPLFAAAALKVRRTVFVQCLGKKKSFRANICRRFVSAQFSGLLSHFLEM